MWITPVYELMEANLARNFHYTYSRDGVSAIFTTQCKTASETINAANPIKENEFSHQCEYCNLYDNTNLNNALFSFDDLNNRVIELKSD